MRVRLAAVAVATLLAASAHATPPNAHTPLSSSGPARESLGDAILDGVRKRENPDGTGARAARKAMVASPHADGLGKRNRSSALAAHGSAQAKSGDRDGLGVPPADNPVQDGAAAVLLERLDAAAKVSDVAGVLATPTVVANKRPRTLATLNDRTMRRGPRG